MRLDTGLVGWAGLTAYIVMWDRYAEETLSYAFGQALTHRQARWPTVTVWVAVTGHLFGVIPKRYDPIHNLGRIILRNPARKLRWIPQVGGRLWS